MVSGKNRKNTFRKVKVTESAVGGMQEEYEKVAQDEATKLSTVQKIVLRSPDCGASSRQQEG